MTKRCLHCGRDLPLEDFHVNTRSTKVGRRARCRFCESAARAAQRKNPRGRPASDITGETIQTCACGYTGPAHTFGITQRRKDGSPLYRKECGPCRYKRRYVAEHGPLEAAEWHERAKAIATCSPHMTTDEIGEAVGVSGSTVRNYFRRVKFQREPVRLSKEKRHGPRLSIKPDKPAKSVSYLYADDGRRYSDPCAFEAAVASTGRKLPPHMTGEAIVARLRERIQEAAKRG